MDQDQANHPPAGTSPPQWATQMAELLNAQAVQIQALQDELTRRDHPTLTPSYTQPPTTTYTPTETDRSDTSARRKELLPKAPEFDGTKTDFRPWLSQMEAKLQVDLADDKEIVRFWYVHSRLRGRALQQVTSWVQATQQTGTLTVDGLFMQLRKAYDDSESAERAARKLGILRQGSKPFSTFLAEFDRTILDAGGLYWDEQVKKTFLSNGISTELQEALIATPIPGTYAGYCELLHSVSNNIENIKSRKKKDLSRTTYNPPAQEKKDEGMDWEPTPAINAASARSKRAMWVTQKVMDARREKGCCYRCGEDGHVVRDCKFLPAVRPGVQTAAQQQRKSSDTVSDTESGKE